MGVSPGLTGFFGGGEAGRWGRSSRVEISKGPSLAKRAWRGTFTITKASRGRPAFGYSQDRLGNLLPKHGRGRGRLVKTIGGEPATCGLLTPLGKAGCDGYSRRAGVPLGVNRSAHVFDLEFDRHPVPKHRRCGIGIGFPGSDSNVSPWTTCFGWPEGVLGGCQAEKPGGVGQESVARPLGFGGDRLRVC